MLSQERAPGGKELGVGAIMVAEGLLHHGQARGSPVQLAQVHQSGLLPLQLAREPLYVWQPCMPQLFIHACLQPEVVKLF